MIPELLSKLNKLEEYTGLLKGYRKHTITEISEDVTLRGAIERYMQLAIETVLEIGEMIISNKGFRKPETYKEIIQVLGNNNVIKKEFSRRFASVAGFRNILVHRYDDIDMDELYSHLQKDVKDFDTFAKQVSDYMRKGS